MAAWRDMGGMELLEPANGATPAARSWNPAQDELIRLGRELGLSRTVIAKQIGSTAVRVAARMGELGLAIDRRGR